MSGASSPRGDGTEPDWLRLQKKIFSRYVEQRLKDGGIKRQVNNLVEEMKSGELLMELLQVMSGLSSGKKLKDTKMRIQQIQNVNDALDFAKKAGVDLGKIRISAEDFVDGSEQAVLAAVFQIIIRFLKFDEEEDEKKGGGGIDVREALMLWLKNKTAGYQGVNIKDFTKSFQDGLPFLALVHKMRPRLIDYDSAVGRSGKVNVELALDLGEKYLNIPKYITAEDLPKLNEISMLVYLTDWYAGVVLLQKQDIAAARIGKLVDITELHDKLKAEYIQRAQSITSWVDHKIHEHADRTIDDTMSGIKARLAAFYQYKKVEKAEQIGLELDAIALYDNISARLVNHKRPKFLPSKLVPDDLENAFKSLEAAEIERSLYLNAELARQIHLAKLYRRFQGNTQKLTSWAQSREQELNAPLKINSVEDAEDAIDSIDVLDGELGHMLQGALADLNKLGANLISERFEHSSSVKSTQQELSGVFAGVQNTVKTKRSAAQKELQNQKDINERLYQAFAAAVNQLQQWVHQKRDALQANEKHELEQQLKAVQAMVKEAEQAQGSLIGAVESADHALQQRELVNNPHTNVSLGDATSTLSSFVVLVQKKAKLLEEQIEEKKRGGLSPEQVAEIHANFAYFDKDSNGFLNKKELRTCLQSLGEESTPQAMQSILDKYDTAKKGTINKAEFEIFIRESLGDTGTSEEIIKSFQYLCYEAQTITCQQLVNVVNNRTFTDHHVDYLKKEIKQTGNDAYNYAQWTQEAFAR